MTVTLTYDGTISRVRINGTDLGTDCDHALVERSTDLVTWATVRGGTEWPVTSEVFDQLLDDYEFPANLLTTYRVNPFDATNFPASYGPVPLSGLVLDGTSGDYASTPDHASLDITGDIDLRAEVTLRDWTPAGITVFVGKWNATGNQKSYQLGINADGTLRLSWSADGAASIARSSTVAPTIPASGRLAVRVTLDVDNGASGHTVTFYTAGSIDGTWTQLGTPVVTAGVTSIFSGSAVAEVGSSSAGTSDRLAGIVHAAEVRTGINGTVVANPDFEAATNNAASFADSTGKTWTVQGSAEIVNPQTNTITANLTDVWLKSVAKPFLNRPITIVALEGPERPSKSGIFEVVDRSFPVGVTEARGSRRFTLTVQTATRNEAEDLDLVLAAMPIAFLHVPPDFDQLHLPSLYAVIDSTVQVRINPHKTPTTRFVLPFIEVAAPPATVTGTTATWQTVINNYADWNALIADKATWKDVVEIVGSPGDVIVT